MTRVSVPVSDAVSLSANILPCGHPPVNPLYWSLLASCLGVSPAFADDAFFESKIRPVLVEKCHKCHSSQKQQGGLRLDNRASLVKGGDTAPAIIPGKTTEGLLLAALSHQGELKMPPSGKLPPETLKDFEFWIAQGAPWPAEKNPTPGGRTQVIMPTDRAHWAFQKLHQPVPPQGKKSARLHNDIDRFLQANMDRSHLFPVEKANKPTLIRRATFDLTGLPPTPEEILAFEADPSPEAFSRLVDRLLASPRYGERWGRHWLDVARYGDTAGDGADYPLPEAWKYRNWVIRSFNSDMPYNQFVREQIAGDILANESNGNSGRTSPTTPAPDQIIATGFLAIGKRYGYAPNTDYQYLDFADVIESIGRSLLGLSLGCARCHDHKYEPIGTEDYYALYGIFQSSQWSFPGGEEHKKPDRLVPLVPTDEIHRLAGQKAVTVAALKTRLREILLQKAQLSGEPIVGGPDLGFEKQNPKSALGSPWLAIGPNSLSPEAQSPFNHIHPKGKQGVRMSAGASNDGVRYVFADPVNAQPGKKIHFSIDFHLPGNRSAPGAFRLYLGRGVIASTALDISISAQAIMVKNGTQWDLVAKLLPDTWHSLQINIDPDSKTYEGMITTLNTQRIPSVGIPFSGKKLAPGWDGVIDTFICDGIGHVPGPVPIHDLDNIAFAEVPFAKPGTTTLAPPATTPTKNQLANVDILQKEATARLNAEVARPLHDVAYGVAEGLPANAKIQKRGEPDKLGQEVPRRFLEILGGDTLAPKSKGSGRLELANWITRKENPLFARVMVNRIWQGHFGRGIVPTPSDFGLRGDPPTDPKLLEWLAYQFVESGYSIKAMHRLIMASAAYQRSSQGKDANIALDPNNLLLWRFSKRPLDAESVRDMMLALGGNLDLKTPKGHPFPPQPWGFTIHAPFHGLYESNNRSVYLMSQRNRRHPYLALFDAADPNISTAERLPTTTPTQALFLMNSPFVHDQAKGFALSLLAKNQDDIARIQQAHLLTRGTEPSPMEITESLEFLNSYESALKSNGTPIGQLRPLAWAALSRVLLTSNAALHVD